MSSHFVNNVHYKLVILFKIVGFIQYLPVQLCFGVLQSNENRTPATKWQWNLFYSKVIARSVNTFIQLEDEMINSSLTERGSSLMDRQPHPLLHFLVRMKPTSMIAFLAVEKNVEVTRWVEQVVACALVTQRARVRSPVRTSFLGDLFSGFFLTCNTNISKL